jgi:hypothetical protein
MPFCLCKHILNHILEISHEHSTVLPFACLITKLIIQSGIDVSVEPVMRRQDSLGSQTLMKSNAQLRFEGQDEAPQPPLVQVEIPIGASSSQTTPPPQYDVGYAQLLATLSSMQGDISFIQREVYSISTRVEQCQLDIHECLKHHHPDED